MTYLTLFIVVLHFIAGWMQQLAEQPPLPMGILLRQNLVLDTKDRADIGDGYAGYLHHFFRRNGKKLRRPIAGLCENTEQPLLKMFLFHCEKPLSFLICKGRQNAAQVHCLRLLALAPVPNMKEQQPGRNTNKQNDCRNFFDAHSVISPFCVFCARRQMRQNLICPPKRSRAIHPCRPCSGHIRARCASQQWL